MKEDLIISLLSYSVIFPAALLCFFPMRNKIMFRARFALTSMVLALIAIIAGISIIDAYGAYSYNQLMVPLMLVCFIIFRLINRTSTIKCLCIFLAVCTLMSFISNIANGYDIILHPNGSVDIFSIEAAFLQLALSFGAMLILAYPFYRYGSWLIDNIDMASVWILSTIASLLFYIYNLLLYPRDYTLLAHNKQQFLFYWGSIATMLTLFLLLLIIFYYIVRIIHDKIYTDERNRYLEMEEIQFRKQQEYMNETQETRHDFKHMVRTLNELFDAKDYEAADRFLKNYSGSLPSNEIIRFSSNNAVNAMMNYYSQTAEAHNIKTDWIVVIPDNIPLTDTELCSMIGNILENAITACQGVPEGKRWIQFDAEEMNASQFLIVATNSFNGIVKMRRGNYLSTKRESSGIGLSSIRRIAQTYGGSAEFSNSDTEFYTNVIIPLDGKKESSEKA